MFRSLFFGFSNHKNGIKNINTMRNHLKTVKKKLLFLVVMLVVFVFHKRAASSQLLPHLSHVIKVKIIYNLVSIPFYLLLQKLKNKTINSRLDRQTFIIMPHKLHLEINMRPICCFFLLSYSFMNLFNSIFSSGVDLLNSAERTNCSGLCSCFQDKSLSCMWVGVYFRLVCHSEGLLVPTVTPATAQNCPKRQQTSVKNGSVEQQQPRFQCAALNLRLQTCWAKEEVMWSHLEVNAVRNHRNSADNGHTVALFYSRLLGVFLAVTRGFLTGFLRSFLRVPQGVLS